MRGVVILVYKKTLSEMASSLDNPFLPHYNLLALIFLLNSMF